MITAIFGLPQCGHYKKYCIKLNRTGSVRKCMAPTLNGKPCGAIITDSEAAFKRWIKRNKNHEKMY